MLFFLGIHNILVSVVIDRSEPRYLEVFVYSDEAFVTDVSTIV